VLVTWTPDLWHEISQPFLCPTSESQHRTNWDILCQRSRGFGDDPRIKDMSDPWHLPRMLPSHFSCCMQCIAWIGPGPNSATHCIQLSHLSHVISSFVANKIFKKTCKKRTLQLSQESKWQKLTRSPRQESLTTWSLCYENPWGIFLRSKLSNWFSS